MKRSLWMAAAMFLALPLLAQQEDVESDAPEFSPGFSGAPQGQRRNFARNPLEQMEEVFDKAGVPLSQEQKKSLQEIMNEQRQAFREAGERARQTPGERRGMNPQMARMGEAFQGKLLSVLTQKQQQVWKKYQAEQIRQRGGYPALRLMLEEAGSPIAQEQEAALQTEFQDYNRQRRDVQQAAGGKADPAKLKELENQHLARVIKLLNPEQRRALIESRRKDAKNSN
ncbi:MAG: hypothetical protein HY313_10230 [Acidobacteria bacterium]|nr:hypothetical protein [Acidobacteriota bacterium]